jgi:hypothetical protein
VRYFFTAILSISLILISLGQDFKVLKLKAAFIYHFTKYLEWPVEKQKSEFIIGVLKDEIIFKELELIANYKKVIGKQNIVIKFFSQSSNLADCNILYVPHSNDIDWEQVSLFTDKNKILLITDGDIYSCKGADISFIYQDNQLGFELNKKEILKNNIKIAGELFQMEHK